MLIREPQQPRAEETRRKILEQAHSRRTGMPGASLTTSADDVGIHRAGILYYFRSKRALYEEVVASARRV